VRKLLRPSVNWLLVFVPAAVVLRYFTHAPATWVFFVSAAAIVPLAGWLGKATEELANRTTQAIGGLLNATFGNAAELIIALFALQRGLTGVVKASLTGAIIGNILLVLGASALAGGVRFTSQTFNAAAARVQATMLTLAAIALIIPSVFFHLLGPNAVEIERDLSTEIAVVLIVTYGLHLLFSLRTHRQYFSAQSEPGGQGSAHAGWSTRRALALLTLSTAAVGWMSEILVSSVEHAAATLGLTGLFVGVIIVGIVGNAAEHSTAIFAARQNKMDLAVGIAVGSTLQIALFVAPVLVLASYFLGPVAMDLVFTIPEIVAIGLAVWIAEQISADGEMNWLEGVQLLAVYAVMAMAFYFLPEGAVSAPGH
jgi:Ca2+:H+ antiporter